jgi:putative tRNA adenosine deaminase-associated protein
MTNEADFAVAAWHEDGRWTLVQLPNPHDLAHIIDGLKSQRTNGGAMLIRVLGSHISMFLSDVTCAFDYEVAAEFVELADLPSPDENDEPLPVGHLDILADLGMNHMEISALCDDSELFPDEQLDAIATRLGFGEEFRELIGL